METAEILQQTREVFIQVFKNPGLPVTAETSAKDVAGWDSLTNIRLILAVEKRFGVRFQTSDIRRWKNVGEMCAAVEKLLKTA